MFLKYEKKRKICILELFSLGVIWLRCYEWISIHNRRFCSNGGRFDPKFQGEAVATFQPFFFSQTFLLFCHSARVW